MFPQSAGRGKVKDKPHCKFKNREYVDSYNSPFDINTIKLRDNLVWNSLDLDNNKTHPGDINDKNQQAKQCY